LEGWHLCRPAQNKQKQASHLRGKPASDRRQTVLFRRGSARKRSIHRCQAERPVHSSTEAEDYVHRMEGWAKRAPLTTCSAEKRKTRGKTGAQVSPRRKHPDVCPLPASRFGADNIHLYAGRQESERARSPMRHGRCLHAEQPSSCEGNLLVMYVIR
jgi:hypothetical protein